MDTSVPAKPGQTIVKRVFVWGDGNFHTNLSPKKGDTFSNVYAVSSKFTVKMEITDNLGCKNSITKDINILEDEDKDLADIKMKGEITFTEMLGDDSIIEVKMGSSLIKLANTNPTLDLSIGRVIMLGTSYSRIHFFDTDNGKIILL